MIDRSIGPYRVLAKLGEGGMGEVYRARDTSLNRDVALKVLPESVATDADRLARFQREAESLAALNHPNIAHIYGLERSAGTPAIVMELVEGPTLADRIKSGPLPIEEALPIARQIAEALEAAHERGIVHRDLKPANIKVTDDGVVKVLDFGLAKAVEPPGEPTLEAANSPTLTARATQLGVVLGTAAYMAPEQAKGRPVDKRADLWAFGCVLYEMLTGRRTFAGEDVTDTLAGVLKSDPNLAVLPADTPPSIRKLLQRCLEKDRKRRLADAADARFELEEALAAPGAAVAPAADEPRGLSRPLAAAIAVIALLAGAGMAGLASWAYRPAPKGSIARFVAVSEADGAEIGVAANSQDLASSPDGTRLVYSAGGGRFAIRSLDTLAVTTIDNVRSSYGPFISPDGAWIGFNDQADRALKKVSMLGGPTVLICDVGAAIRGADWAEDGTIVFGTNADGGLWRVDAGGGDPVEISEAAPGTSHVWPAVLPGGQFVLFTVHSAADTANTTSEIALLDLQAQRYSVILPGGSYPKYSPTGHLVYAVNGALFAVGFDAGRRQVTTNPTPVVSGVLTKASGSADFDITDNGSLVYVPGTAQDVKRTLVWVDREGREQVVGVPPRTYFYPRLSPDGTRVALDVREENGDIWIWNLARQNLTRLTSDAGLDRMPVWSPEGDRVVYTSQREGVTNLFWRAPDGTGPVERLTEGPGAQYPSAMTPDGSQVILRTFGQPTAWDLMIADVGDDVATARPLVATEFSEWNGEVSPNSRWLAYESNESGRYEIYVRPFPDVDAGRWLVSNDGGTRPAWRRDSRELFYFDAGRMMAVAIEDEAQFLAGAPQLLFQGDYATPQVGRTYDVTADGQRFLMLKDLEDTDETRRIVVVLNWLDELNRLVPVR